MPQGNKANFLNLDFHHLKTKKNIAELVWLLWLCVFLGLENVVDIWDSDSVHWINFYFAGIYM